MVDLNSNRDDILALVNKFKEEALVPMKVSWSIFRLFEKLDKIIKNF